jgi:hypothetical protein
MLGLGMFQHLMVVSRPPENRKSPLGLMDKLNIGPRWPLETKLGEKKASCNIREYDFNGN